MHSSPQVEQNLDADFLLKDNVAGRPLITCRSYSASAHLRWLPPAMMWAELEHCRKIADLVEEPFALLVCKARKSISLELLRSFTFADLHRHADILGPIGLLHRKHLGLVVRKNCLDHIDAVVDSIKSAFGEELLQFEVLSYPFALDDTSFPENHAGSRSRLTCKPLQPLFVLPTPWGKRVFDVAVASIGTLVLLPLFFIVAILIRCSSKGPVLFKQRRVGLGGISFEIYKFRTMVADAENQKSVLKHLNEQDGPAFKIKADPRVTRIGRVLRYTCIDELPQLWNVLRGNMSLVGPRPLPCEESDACRWWHRRRLDVQPGITCTWQARGRSMVSFDEWMRLDLEYVRRRSFGFDSQVLFATFAFLLVRRSHKLRDPR